MVFEKSFSVKSNDSSYNGLTVDEKFELLRKESDQFFLIVVSLFIFFMQAGFAFLEAGSVRTKNTVNILLKNTLDAFIGGVAYWAIGWALAYGEGGQFMTGGSGYFNYKLDYGQYPNWFFSFVFAATAATIVSGAIAERCQFLAYFVYSMLITGWVYPPVSHWAWDTDGWLSQTGLYHDFAGSGVVHLLGANCALVGCYFIGPRKGRFSESGKVVNFPGHSVPLTALGAFILILGFLAFNGGSQGSITEAGDADTVALAIVNTILGAAAGGLSVMFLHNKFSSPWSFLMTLNGSLAGMVSLCAGCNLYEPWAALIVGAMGGGLHLGIHHLMLRFRLDDPLDAVAVHGGGGLVGLLSVPWFMYVNLEDGQRGIFWDGDQSHPWWVLAYHLVAAATISLWAILWSVQLFGLLTLAKIFRVKEDQEREGMDITKHGESAYPATAWLEQGTSHPASLNHI